MFPESRYSLNYRFYLVRRNQARALELARRAPVTRATQKIRSVEGDQWVIPAAVAGMIVDHSVGSSELVKRMCEAADHHDGGPDSPG